MYHVLEETTVKNVVRVKLLLIEWITHIKMCVGVWWCSWSQFTFYAHPFLLLCWCQCLWVHCVFVEVWVSLCWTWRVIAAFVDCWWQVVSHLVTAGKREGWRGFGDRRVLSGGGRDGCTPLSITHGWTAGAGAVGGIVGWGEDRG